MNKILIGYTGAVGKTLLEQGQYDLLFNTSNIKSFNSKAKDGDELYLSCLPAEKWKINNNLKEDFANINSIINVISNVNYKKVVLISTIDVYLDSPLGVNEDYDINFSKFHYGSNRYLFEKMVLQFVKSDETKIFRLPGIFGKNIKKNVIFDLKNGNDISNINVNTKFQWYNLDYLTNDINILIKNNKNEIIFNLFTEPTSTKDLITIFDMNTKDMKQNNFFEYNYKTKFNKNGYLYDNNQIIEEIKKFKNDTLC